MSQAIATPPPSTAFGRLAARIWDDPDNRSTTIGIIGVLLIHLLLLATAPYLMRLDRTAMLPRPRSTARQFSIQITPESFAKPKPKPAQPKQFVETNPDAPENTPDRTNNFAAQNQQVAQEKPTPNGKSERPAMEGKKDFESNQIVDGRLQKPQEVAPSEPQVETPPTPMTVTPPRAEQNPLPGYEKTQGDNPTAFGSAASTEKNNVRNIPERVEGEKDVPLIEGATGLQPAIDRNHPRSRPQLVKTTQTRPAILAENKFGTENVGVTAINARFNDYGAYLHRLAEAVQLEWDGLLDSSKSWPPSGTYVVVRFVINSEGKIVRFGDVENHSSEWGRRACESAISNRAPYGPWTDDMKAALNPEGEELMFTFYYQ